MKYQFDYECRALINKLIVNNTIIALEKKDSRHAINRAKHLASLNNYMRKLFESFPKTS